MTRPSTVSAANTEMTTHTPRMMENATPPKASSADQK